MKKFTDSNEWIEIEGDIATIGISKIAVKHIGKIMNVQLPHPGENIKKEQEIVVLESTKAAIDVYSPLTGIVVEVNNNLKKNADLINLSPEDDGWLIKIKVNKKSEL